MKVSRAGWLVAIAGLALLQGCASQGKPAQITSWPLPPDPPRYVYEATLRSEESLLASGSSVLSAITGDKPGAAAVTFGKPFDVAARKGRIAVTDTTARLVHLFDVPRRTVLRFGTRGEGKLAKPVGLDMDDKINIYVADITSRRVMIYDENGHFIRALGSEADFVRPSDVAVTPSGDRIYVVDDGGIDTQEHRVLAYDAEGKLLFVIGTRGKESGQFNLPTQAIVSRDGTLYVLDAGNFRVQAFDRDGNFLRSFGQVGRNFGDMARPRGLGADMEGNLYITDGAFANFQVFTPEGKLLLPVGESGKLDGPGNFSLPAGIAVDETNRVYVVDQLYNKVEVLRKLSDEESQKMAPPKN